MNVAEGLSCGFHQQAVVIDWKNDQDYVPLGRVQRTVVITPDLDASTSHSM
jgi:RNA polymerase III RPC4